MRDSFLIVVRLSSSFGELWRQLAETMKVEVRVVPPNDLRSVPPPRAAAVLLAAGGVEREAIEWLESREKPSAPVFVVGSDPGRRVAAQIVARGASDYFAIPEDTELLRNAVGEAVARCRPGVAPVSSKGLDEELVAFRAIAGESPAVKVVLYRAARLLQHAQGTVLIAGEDGTGKETLARAIHEGGPRRLSPFVPVNCSALPRHLIESDLFGCERGALPDAHASRPGLFEVAEGGTLFLDEVNAVSLDLQAKLFRVLEDHEIRRVGSTKARRVDVRVIAAADEDLQPAVRRGTFRRDLYLRLGVVALDLPPLRERGDDVLIIADRLVASLAAVHGLPVPEIRADVRQALREYSWPGNVRELKNALERALLLSSPGTLSAAEMIPPAKSTLAWTAALPFPAQLDDIATAAARATLEACGGNVSRAARQLCVSRGRLRRLVRVVSQTVAGPTAGAR
ncbi:MAG: sigma-54-dependent Fis family transcriptional regulator [Gemmatimonadetes bacterium]|nr:sigma-54-dependent Fis family transcriptional regulator [Gemmatimonadota bacterium]